MRSHNLSKRSDHHKRIVAKHGIEILIFQRDSEQHAFDDEIKWIKVLREAGYELANKTNGGEGCSGCSPSIETRKKISKSNKGKLKGRKLSPEHCAKIGIAMEGNKYLLGHKHLPESRMKMSVAQKASGNKPPSWADKNHTPETKAKMAVSALIREARRREKNLKLKPRTPEHCLAISEGLKRAKEKRDKSLIGDVEQNLKQE